MTILIDLFPRATRRAGRGERLERACEQIEATAGRLFSEPTIGRAIGSYGAAATVIQSLLALGLIDRISPPRARQVWYVVPRRHMPRITP